MDQYRVYDVKIRKEDRDKADAILFKHYDKGDLDEFTLDVVVHKDRDGNDVITYRIKPYIYEDLETIINEFKQVGIKLL